MTLNFNTLFGQRDVRETATATVGTKFWSCSGWCFHPNNANEIVSTEIDWNTTTRHSFFNENDNLIGLFATVNLPHGAVVTGAIVYGNAGTSNATWILHRVPFATAVAETMATASAGTEDTTISSAIIDNSLYGYHFHFANGEIDANDEIFGARITYTI